MSEEASGTGSGQAGSGTLSEEQLAALLRSHEESLLDPAVRRDRARVAALLADDFQESGASGRVWTREQVLDLLGKEGFQRPAMENFECRQISAGVALIGYLCVRSDPRTGERSATLRSSLWTEELGEWKMRFHQGTRAL